MEELDYELEAQNQRAFARGYRGHPFIHVPDVVTRLSTERVLVSEWVDGAGFDEVRELPQAERDRFGEIVFRFCFGSIYHLQHFNADAHPGQLPADARRARRVPRLRDDQAPRRRTRSSWRSRRSRRSSTTTPSGLRVALHDLGFLNDPRKVDAELLMDHVRAVGGWYMEDREVTIDSARVMEAIAAVSDPRSDFYRVDAPREPARQRADGTAHGVGRARRAGPAERHPQLVPDRPRVVVRRAAGHRARASRSAPGLRTAGSRRRRSRRPSRR